MNSLLIIFVRVYRKAVAPVKNILLRGYGTCRFQPTCSAYALDALHKHNWRRALWLVMRRLLRCHPWGGSGFDPVPCTMPADDEKWMAEAISQALLAEGQTDPNPIVGAVVVRDGVCLGRGYHRMAGCPHAELEAIQDALSRVESLCGAALYVTLEPCCTHGRTPPCTDAILNSGISEVVIGTLDPNPLHLGRGIQILRAEGIVVREGILRGECYRLNPSFNSRFQKIVSPDAPEANYE